MALQVDGAKFVGLLVLGPGEDLIALGLGTPEPLGDLGLKHYITISGYDDKSVVERIRVLVPCRLPELYPILIIGVAEMKVLESRIKKRLDKLRLTGGALWVRGNVVLNCDVRDRHHRVALSYTALSNVRGGHHHRGSAFNVH